MRLIVNYKNLCTGVQCTDIVTRPEHKWIKHSRVYSGPVLYLDSDSGSGQLVLHRLEWAEFLLNCDRQGSAGFSATAGAQVLNSMVQQGCEQYSTARFCAVQNSQACTAKCREVQQGYAQHSHFLHITAQPGSERFCTIQYTRFCIVQYSIVRFEYYSSVLKNSKVLHSAIQQGSAQCNSARLCTVQYSKVLHIAIQQGYAQCNNSRFCTV
jgi:hypothetical protein